MATADSGRNSFSFSSQHCRHGPTDQSVTTIVKNPPTDNWIIDHSLVTGSANGKHAELFGKIKTLHEKYGPFDVVLSTGNFFSEDPNADLGDLFGNKIDGTLYIHLCARVCVYA